MKIFYAIIAVLAAVHPSLAAEEIPLPRSRPPSIGLTYIPMVDDAMSSAAELEEAMGCRIRLTQSRVKAVSVPPLQAPGGCGAPDVVRLEGLTLRDQTTVAFTTPPLLRCGMAEEVAKWVRDDLAPLARSLGSPIKSIESYGSFECRGRNRVAGTRMSEHGRANAVDIRSVKLANGNVYELTDRAVARDFREDVRKSTCAHFTTVLGPGSDGYHEEHIHIDLAERRGGHRLCQWDVRDPVPEVPLPRPRPDFEAVEAKAKIGDEKTHDVK